MGTFAGHTDGITYIDTKDDSRHIITNSKDQSIKLWDLRKFASKRSIEQTRKAVRNQNWDYRWARFPGMYKYIIYIVLYSFKNCSQIIILQNINQKSIYL